MVGHRFIAAKYHNHCGVFWVLNRVWFVKKFQTAHLVLNTNHYHLYANSTILKPLFHSIHLTTMNQKSLLSSACLSAALLFSPALIAQTLTWQGQSLELQHTPRNIAVYELSALDTLQALGVSASIVPDAVFPATLASYNQGKATKAGSLFEPDVAVLSAQKPDLIIVGGRSKAKQDTVKDLAPTLDLSPNTDHYMADLQARTELLANTFGKQAAAAKRLRTIQTKQAKLKAQTQGKTALMLFTNKGNFMPHAAGERFGFVYDFAGFKSVLPVVPPKDENAPAQPRPEAGSLAAEAAKVKAAERLQAAVNQQPDYLIVLDRGAVNTNEYTAAAEMQKNAILQQTKGKVIMVDANAWYLTGAGLANTELMLDELIKATQ